MPARCRIGEFCNKKLGPLSHEQNDHNAILSARSAHDRRGAMLALLATLILSFSIAADSSRAQAPDQPIEENVTLDAYIPILAKALQLKDSRRLLDDQAVRTALARPTPAPVKLVPRATDHLSRRQMARRGRAALIRVGWIYRDPESEKPDWQLDLAAAYAITADGVAATCRHVIDPDYLSPITEGFLIAVDAQGDVLPVTAILAAEEEMDAALIRIEGGALVPVALNDEAAVGDSVAVFSDPMNVTGYFSAGYVNRFYWFDPDGGKDPHTLAGARNLRIHVSADWAPGSSGAPLLDDRGNSIGHVAEVETLLDDPSVEAAEQPDLGARREDVNKETSDAAEEMADDPYADSPATMMVLHSATPARAVRLLAEETTRAASHAALQGSAK
jgi:S1-C subfamily serine protease